jgi:tetratricopeptide (TPR) repeat protein
VKAKAIRSTRGRQSARALAAILCLVTTRVVAAEPELGAPDELKPATTAAPESESPAGCSAGGNAAVVAAEELASRAFAAYQAGEYAWAISTYLEAHACSPAADMLYNVARIYELKLGDAPLAVAFYRRFIEAPGAAPARVGFATRRVLALESGASERTVESGVTLRADAAPSPKPRSTVKSAKNSFAPAIVITGALGALGVATGIGYGVAAVTSTGGTDRYATLSTLGFGAGGLLIATSAALLLFEQRGQQPQTGWVVAPSMSANADTFGLSAVKTW